MLVELDDTLKVSFGSCSSISKRFLRSKDTKGVTNSSKPFSLLFLPTEFLSALMSLLSWL